jgi:hypothetical protein
MNNTNKPASLAESGTVSFEEQREIWLGRMPELARLFDAIPMQAGTIRVYTSKIPHCPGALMLSVSVNDTRDNANYWWCECECVHRPEGGLEQRGRQAASEIDGLRAARATRNEPAREWGSNVASFEWYKQRLEKERI